MYKLKGPFTPSESEKDHKEQVKEIKEKISNISFRFRLRWKNLNNENWVLKILTSRTKHTSSSGMTLGLTYNEFGYYEHPAITSNFFSQERALLSSVTRSTAYNEQIFMNLHTGPSAQSCFNQSWKLIFFWRFGIELSMVEVWVKLMYLTWTLLMQ